MSIELVRQNTLILRQTAEQFASEDISGGKSSFGLVHCDIKEGVYYTMWQMNGSPNIPKFGTDRFNDSNGHFSSSIEKAQAIYQYLSLKGISPRANNNSREQVSSHSGNRYVYVNDRYVPASEAGLEATESFGAAVREVSERCQECDEVGRFTVLLVLGSATVITGTFFGVAYQVANLFKHLPR